MCHACQHKSKSFEKKQNRGLRQAAGLVQLEVRYSVTYSKIGNTMRFWRARKKKEEVMRKFLILALVPVFFAATACQKSEETPAPESAASAPAAAASEPGGAMASPAGGEGGAASPAGGEGGAPSPAAS